jgi:hypothetical protein
MTRILLAGSLFLAGPAAEAANARTEVTPRRGHIGEIVKLRIHVDRARGDRVTLPRTASFRPFEVIHRRVSTEASGHRVRETLELELMVFETGDQVIPSVDLRVYDKAGHVSTLSTDPATVHIASVLGNEPDAKRRGNHGPVPVFEKDYTWGWVLAAVVAFFLQFLLIRWLMKRRAKIAPAPIVIEKRPPWEIALEKLRGIDRSRLVEKGLVKEHYDGVSDAIREYLGALAGFDGLESTTEEVLARLRTETPRGVDVMTVEHLFGDCDLVKFAKYAPAADEPKGVFSMALRIVETSRAAQLAAMAAAQAAAAAFPPPEAPPPEARP